MRDLSEGHGEKGALRPLKLCLFSHASGLYGAEAAMIELIEALAPHGIEPHVVLHFEGPLQEALRQRGIPYSLLPGRWWMDRKNGMPRRVANTLFNLLWLPRVALAVRRIRPDVLYTNTLTLPTGAFAARLLGLPHIWHLHEFGAEDHGLRFNLGERLSYWIMQRTARRFIAVSEAIRLKHARRLPEEKITVLYQSVTPPKFNSLTLVPPRTGGFRCAMVGYLQEEKGQHEAVQAMGILKARGLMVELLILGTGIPGYEQRLRRMVQEGGLQDRVRFMGFVQDPFAYMLDSDAVLVGSKSEAFGRVTVEAMMAGRPVVGARAGCTQELVSEGINGLLYEPGDAQALADKIEYLCRHPELAARMGEAGRRMSEGRFGKERYGAEMAVLIREAAA